MLFRSVSQSRYGTATMERGNIDPTFDSCKLVEAAGASSVARETMIDPKKLERTLVKALEHKGFSYLEGI